MTEQKYEAGNEYTPAEHLALANEALARALKFGIEYKAGQFRATRRAELDQLQASVEYWTRRVSAQSSGPARNLVRFVRPS